MARKKSELVVDADELVEQHWPYDGPHSYDSVLQAARAMTALARYLGNATGPGGNGLKTLALGPHVYRVLGAVSGALGSLDQVLEQLADAEKRVGADPTAYDDRRDRPASATTGEVITAIQAARDLLFKFSGGQVTVHAHLQTAHSLSSHIGHNL